MAFFEFPHTRTYDSDLGWLIHAYQLLKAQADDIQGSIQQIIDDALNDPTYVARVLAVLAPLNVKYPPSDAGLDAAKGDGVTDDTDAITGMIAYAYEHGMPLLFPAGQYVVSGLTVSNDMTFIGLGGTLFLKAGAVNPLITVKGGYLTATGLEFNGNIAGQTEPKNVFVVDGGGFKLDNCVIMGGVDGIHADIDSPSFLTAVDIRNFTEYGIYVEGTSFINANGLTMDVASGGALRLMRVDASNCVFNGVESPAEVAIAFDVTGDSNYFLARVPNVETPTSDDGQNNNFEIITQLSKRTYQILSEKVAEDYTQEVGDFDGTATGHYSFSGRDVIIDSENPLTYKAPQKLNDYFNYIPFKDSSGTNYNVLVKGANLEEIRKGIYINVKDYGAVGDGVTDDSAAIQNAIDSNESGTIFFPIGTYVVNTTIDLNKRMNVLGDYAFIENSKGYGTVIKTNGNTAFNVRLAGTSIQFLSIIGSGKGDGIAIYSTIEEQVTHDLFFNHVFIDRVAYGIRTFTVGIFKTIFMEVCVHESTGGFLIGGTSNTSLTFINCWGTWCQTAYSLANAYYCSFINCCCDNGYQIGWNLASVHGCTLINCSIERTANQTVETNSVTYPPFWMQDCESIDISCAFAEDYGKSGENTMLILIQRSKNVAIHDCHVSGTDRVPTYFVYNNDGNSTVIYNNTAGAGYASIKNLINNENQNMNRILSTQDIS